VLLFDNSRQFATYCLKSITHSDINILVLMPIDGEFMAGQRNVNRNAIGPTLMLVFFQLLDAYAACHEFACKSLELSNLLYDDSGQTFAGFKAAKAQM
jgi:hypothetical protein